MRKIFVLLLFAGFLSYIATAKEKKISQMGEHPTRMCNKLNELSIVDHYFIKTIDSIFFSVPLRKGFKKQMSSYPYFSIQIDSNKWKRRNTPDTLVYVTACNTPEYGNYGYIVYNKHTYVIESQIKALKQKKKTKTFFYNSNFNHFNPFHTFIYKNGKLTFLEPDDFDYE